MRLALRQAAPTLPGLKEDEASTSDSAPSSPTTGANSAAVDAQPTRVPPGSDASQAGLTALLALAHFAARLQILTAEAAAPSPVVPGNAAARLRTTSLADLLHKGRPGAGGVDQAGKTPFGSVLPPLHPNRRASVDSQQSSSSAGPSQAGGGTVAVPSSRIPVVADVRGRVFEPTPVPDISPVTNLAPGTVSVIVTPEDAALLGTFVDVLHAALGNPLGQSEAGGSTDGPWQAQERGRRGSASSVSTVGTLDLGGSPLASLSLLPPELRAYTGVRGGSLVGALRREWTIAHGSYGEANGLDSEVNTPWTNAASASSTPALTGMASGHVHQLPLYHGTRVSRAMSSGRERGSPAITISSPVTVTDMDGATGALGLNIGPASPVPDDSAAVTPLAAVEQAAPTALIPERASAAVPGPPPTDTQGPAMQLRAAMSLPLLHKSPSFSRLHQGLQGLLGQQPLTLAPVSDGAPDRPKLRLSQSVSHTVGVLDGSITSTIGSGDEEGPSRSDTSFAPSLAGRSQYGPSPARTTSHMEMRQRMPARWRGGSIGEVSMPALTSRIRRRNSKISSAVELAKSFAEHPSVFRDEGTREYVSAFVASVEDEARKARHGAKLGLGLGQGLGLASLTATKMRRAAGAASSAVAVVESMTARAGSGVAWPTGPHDPSPSKAHGRRGSSGAGAGEDMLDGATSRRRSVQSSPAGLAGAAAAPGTGGAAISPTSAQVPTLGLMPSPGSMASLSSSSGSTSANRYTERSLPGPGEDVGMSLADSASQAGWHDTEATSPQWRLGHEGRASQASVTRAEPLTDASSPVPDSVAAHHHGHGHMHGQGHAGGAASAELVSQRPRLTASTSLEAPLASPSDIPPLPRLPEMEESSLLSQLHHWDFDLLGANEVLLDRFQGRQGSPRLGLLSTIRESSSSLASHGSESPVALPSRAQLAFLLGPYASTMAAEPEPPHASALIPPCEADIGPDGQETRASLQQAAQALYQRIDLKESRNGLGTELLVAVTCTALARTGVVSSLGLDQGALTAYVSRIARGYDPAQPYHNALHAADVTQAVFHVLTAGGMVPGGPAGVYNTARPTARLTPLQTAACLLASAVHDVGHPGLNNVFLVATSHPLALTYNDRSPLENMHSATAFLAMREAGCDVLAPLAPADRTALRATVIDLVLATDNGMHFKMMARLGKRQARWTRAVALAERNRKRRASATSSASSFLGPSEALEDDDEEQVEEEEDDSGDDSEDEAQAGGSGTDVTDADRASVDGLSPTAGSALLAARLDMRRKHDEKLLLRAILHGCDISNPARSWVISGVWSERVTAEFHAQGEAMAKLGMAVPPMFLRQAGPAGRKRAAMQAGFVTALVLPLWRTLASEPYCAVLGPEPMSAMQARLDGNLARLKTLSDSGVEQEEGEQEGRAAQ